MAMIRKFGQINVANQLYRGINLFSHKNSGIPNAILRAKSGISMKYPPANPSEQPPLRPLGKLEDMKVSDLKVELKRRNLPVSGPKPQLIERLKPFTESSSLNSCLTGNNSNGPHMTHMGHILMDTPGPLTSDDSSSHAKSPGSPIKDEPYSPRMDSSPHNSEHDDPSSPPGDEIIKAQRQHIEQLQRELYKLQQQLQQIRQTPPATVRAEIEYHGINEPTQTSDTTKIELSDETHLSCDRHYNQPVYVDKTLSMTELFTPSGMGRTLSKDIAKGVAEIYMINIANPLY